MGSRIQVTPLEACCKKVPAAPSNVHGQERRRGRGSNANLGTQLLQSVVATKVDYQDFAALEKRMRIVEAKLHR